MGSRKTWLIGWKRIGEQPLRGCIRLIILAEPYSVQRSVKLVFALNRTFFTITEGDVFNAGPAMLS